MTFDEFVAMRLNTLLRYAAVLTGDRELVDECPRFPDEGSVFVTLSHGDPILEGKVSVATGYVTVGEVQGHPAYAHEN